MGSSFANAGQESGQALPCFGGQSIAFDLDPRGLESRKALTGGARVGVCQRSNHAGGAGGDQDIGAGRATVALVRAGLQADIGSATGSVLTCLLQGNGLCMGTTSRLGPAATDNTAILHQYTADRGVGAGAALAAFAERNGSSQPAAFIGARGYLPSPAADLDAAFSPAALAAAADSARMRAASRSISSTSMPIIRPSAL